MSQNIADKYGLDAAAKQKINYLLLRPHKHQHVKGIKKPPFEGNLVGTLFNPDLEVKKSECA